MSYYQFDLLDDRMKGQFIWKHGICVAERFYKCFKVYLFQIHNYYVEVYFNMDFQAIQYVRSFEEQDELQPYLENIDISALVAS